MGKKVFNVNIELIRLKGENKYRVNLANKEDQMTKRAKTEKPRRNQNVDKINKRNRANDNIIRNKGELHTKRRKAIQKERVTKRINQKR